MRLDLLTAGVLVAVVTSCAPTHQGPQFEQMSADEHLRAAAQENDAADREYAAARGELSSQSPFVPAGAIPFEGRSDAFYGPEWEPSEPEYYTIDPRPHIAGGDHADKARKHRQRAERHEQAAAALQGRPYGPNLACVGRGPDCQGVRTD